MSSFNMPAQKVNLSVNNVEYNFQIEDPGNQLLSDQQILWDFVCSKITSGEIENVSGPEDIESITIRSINDSEQGPSQLVQTTAQSEDSDSEGENEKITTNKLWTNEKILSLLHHYKENEKAFDTGMKKIIWDRIAKKLNKDFNELQFNAKNVESKWKTMKRTYKSIKLKNSKSGNATHRWEYFKIMDELFHQRPDIVPPAVCTSTALTKADVQTKEPTPSTSGSDPAGDNQQGTFKRRHAPTANDRHKEKLSRMDRFLDSFDKLIDKI